MLQEIIAIYAVGENHTIGKENDLPWNLPDEFRHFKRITLGKPVIMGRKTYESLGEPLPKRRNIIITRQENYEAPGAEVVHSLVRALELCEHAPSICIIGGAAIYEAAFEMGIVNVVYQTTVHGEFEGDTYFRLPQGEAWESIEAKTHPRDDRHAYAFTMEKLVKKSGLLPPVVGEYGDFYQGYIDQVGKKDLYAQLLRNPIVHAAWTTELTQEQWSFRYAPGKWSLKEMLLHLADTERIMAYRALRFSRQDPSPLSGFDHEAYVKRSDADSLPAYFLIDQLRTIRKSTLDLFDSLGEAAFNQKGTANGFPFSVKALFYIIAGHELHHLHQIQENYLSRL